MSLHDDQLAISLLDETFQLQRAAFYKNPNPGLKERLEWLNAIPPMIMANAKRIAQALNEDFGFHNDITAYMYDAMNVVGRAEFAAENVEQWMQRDYRETGSRLYGSSQAYIEQQPKGVVGNLSAWNFPVDLSFGPLVEMLAAGNRVIIKPSDQVPAVGELMAEMAASTFGRDLVSVATGGLELARHFNALPWDHLLYTGNTTIGREVMLKAAENLVPVTLELGGKNPTVFTEEAVTLKNVRTMMSTKMIKNGQLCITVDHVHVPKASLKMFLRLVQAAIEESMGDYTHSPIASSAIINQRQRDRVQTYIDDARDRPHEAIITIGSPAHEGAPYRMPLTIVVNPDAQSMVCQHEIFGPILPVFTYDDFDAVVEKIKHQDSPLGVYIFSTQADRIEQLKYNTRSGGFSVNGPAMQGAIAALGFGGFGNSGMGRHHGIDGFREFSNPRGCVELADDNQLDIVQSPHGDRAREFIKSATKGLLG